MTPPTATRTATIRLSAAFDKPPQTAIGALIEGSAT